jgi:protein SCO1
MRSRHTRGAARALLTPAVLALALGIALPGCGHKAEGGSGAPASTPGAVSASGFDGALLPAGPRAPEVELSDQSGHPFSLQSLRGQIAILAFLSSTSKRVGPLIAQQIRGALDELARPVAAVAISIDPGADTPAHVRAFLRASALTGRVRYLTGNEQQLRAVWRAYRVVPASAGEAAFERGAFVLLLDRRGAARVELPLEQLTPEALAHDIGKLAATP